MNICETMNCNTPWCMHHHCCCDCDNNQDEELTSDFQSHINDTAIHFTRESLGLDNYVKTKYLTDNYYTKGDSDERYLTRASLDNYALNTQLNNFITRSDLTAYALKTELSKYALSSSLNLYALKSELNGFLTESDITVIPKGNGTVEVATITIGNETLSIKVPAAPSGSTGNSAPSNYLKDAAVQGNTLTITKQDNSTVTFTPSTGSGSDSGSDYTKTTVQFTPSTTVSNSSNTYELGTLKVDGSSTKIYALNQTGGSGGGTVAAEKVYVCAMFKDQSAKPDAITSAYCSDFSNGTLVGITGWSKTKPETVTSDHLWMSIVSFYKDYSVWGDFIDVLMPEPNYKDYINFRIVNIFKYTAVNAGTPSTPSKGSGHFDFGTGLLTAPPNWYTTSSGAEQDKVGDTDILWQSTGVVYDNDENNTWYDAIPLNGKVTEILDLTRVYVAAVYKKSDAQPNRPNGGTYNFTTQELVAPTGWQKTPIAGEDAWVSIKSFYNKTGNDSDWSEPMQVATANIDITALDYTVLANRVTFTENFFNILAGEIDIEGKLCKVVAEEISANFDTMKILGGYIKIDATNMEFLAPGVALNLNDGQLQAIAEKIEVDTNELAVKVAGNADLQAETLKVLAKDNVFIGSVAGSVNITSQLDTQDINVGDGSCFFDGTGSDAGSGYVAKGNIAWDKDGNLNVCASQIINGFQVLDYSDAKYIDKKIYFRIGTDVSTNVILHYNSDYRTEFYFDLPALNLNSRGSAINGVDWPQSVHARGLVKANAQNDNTENFLNVAAYAKHVNRFVGSNITIQFVDHEMLSEQNLNQSYPNIEYIYFRGASVNTYDEHNEQAGTYLIDDWYAAPVLLKQYVKEHGNVEWNPNDYLSWVNSFTFTCTMNAALPFVTSTACDLIAVNSIESETPDIKKNVYFAYADPTILPANNSNSDILGAIVHGQITNS